MDTGLNLENEVKILMNIKEKFDKMENIGVIGSPSSTSELTVDVLGTAVNKGLVGKFSILNYFQDGMEHYALGQITETRCYNERYNKTKGQSGSYYRKTRYPYCKNDC